jgi:hypothetical protein
LNFAFETVFVFQHLIHLLLSLIARRWRWHCPFLLRPGLGSVLVFCPFLWPYCHVFRLIVRGYSPNLPLNCGSRTQTHHRARWTSRDLWCFFCCGPKISDQVCIPSMNLQWPSQWNGKRL